MKREECNIDIPAPSRQQKQPARYAVGDDTAHFPKSTEDYYKAIYYEAVDTITRCIKKRFDQPGYKKYCVLEALF